MDGYEGGLGVLKKTFVINDKLGFNAMSFGSADGTLIVLILSNVNGKPP